MSIPRRRRSPTKMQDYRAKGLCFNYDDKFVPGHRAQFQSRLKLKRLAEEKEKSPKACLRRKCLKLLALQMQVGEVQCHATTVSTS
jgi:hypothetical protein